MTLTFRACAAATLLAALAAGPALAQSGGWQSSLSVTPFYQGNADLDGGGDFSVFSTIVRAGASTSIGGANRGGITLSYDYSDYSFSNPSAFGGVAPWGIVQRYGVSAPLQFVVDGDWGIGVTPTVQWSRENGADSGESLYWGALVAATRSFADGNRIGFGVGVYQRIEKTSAFPVLLIDWKLGDRWRLINPLPVGPTGGAGLELDYRLDSGWNLGLGATWQSERFRLSETGPVPNGIGEQRGVPVFLRASRNFNAQTSLFLYAGAVTSGQLRVEDQSGNLLRKVDADPALLLGLTFVARF